MSVEDDIFVAVDVIDWIVSTVLAYIVWIALSPIWLLARAIGWEPHAADDWCDR